MVVKRHTKVGSPLRLSDTRIVVLLYTTLLYSTTFMIKSTTLSDHRDGPRLEAKVISNGLSELETVPRGALGIEGGRSVVASTASVDLLYIDAKLSALSPLPFKVIVDGVEIVFDELEPCPVIESDESSAATSSGEETATADVMSEVNESHGIHDKCVEFVRSVSATSAHGTEVSMVNICVETSPTVAIIVECSRDEYDQIDRSLVCCFGYTQTNERCPHRRKSPSGEKVWCYHHLGQQREYHRFRLFGDRPSFCKWWSDDECAR